MKNLESFYTRWSPYLLSILRIMTAALFIEHGGQKLLGFPPSPMHTVPLFSFMGLGGALELIGGLLLLIGLGTRPVAFILSGEMAVAYFMAHAKGGFFPVNNHGELAVLYCFVFLYLAIAGGGPVSLDRLFRRHAPAAGVPCNTDIVT